MLKSNNDVLNRIFQDIKLISTIIGINLHKNITKWAGLSPEHGWHGDTSSSLSAVEALNEKSNCLLYFSYETLIIFLLEAESWSHQKISLSRVFQFSENALLPILGKWSQEEEEKFSPSFQIYTSLSFVLFHIFLYLIDDLSDISDMTYPKDLCSNICFLKCDSIS